MPITKKEYDDLIEKSDAGQICFFFDPAQCKNFLLDLNNEECESVTGKSLRIESGIVKFIVYFLEPVCLLCAMVSGLFWVKWWGLLVVAGVFAFWILLKSMSSGGKQRIFGPLLIFSCGMFLALVFRGQGPAYITFVIALSMLYLGTTMLYALPVLFFSVLTRSNYAIANLLYENPVDNLNQEMGIPLMWHVDTTNRKLPKSEPQLPSRLFLTIYGIFNKECRDMAFNRRRKPGN